MMCMELAAEHVGLEWRAFPVPPISERKRLVLIRRCVGDLPAYLAAC